MIIGIFRILLILLTRIVYQVTGYPQLSFVWLVKLVMSVSRENCIGQDIEWKGCKQTFVKKERTGMEGVSIKTQNLKSQIIPSFSCGSFRNVCI